MKIRFFSLLGLFTAMLIGNSAFSQQVIYVSPKGNDISGKGTVQQPYASLQKAYNQGLAYSGKETLYIRMAAGRYELSRPVRITASPAAPVVIEGAADGRTVLSGAKRIRGWMKGPNGTWVAHVEEAVRYGWQIEQLYVNGKRAVRARTPDEGAFLLEGTKEWNLFDGQQRTPSFAVERYQISPEQLSSLKGVGYEPSNRMVANFYHKWSITRRRVSKTVTDSGYVFTSGMPWEKWNPISKGSRMVLENYKQALSMPGEWFLDSDGTLFYIPRPGERLEDLEVYAPALQQLLLVYGKKDRPVQHLTFRNISVEHAAYAMPMTGNAPVQAAADISSAIEVKQANHVHFSNCEVAHTGNYALSFGRGSTDCSLERSRLYDLGAGAVKIGEFSLPGHEKEVVRRIGVENNKVYGTGKLFPSAVGIVVFHSSDNKILHNELSDMMYTGISVGWTWGYRDSYAINNEIAYNYIHHIGLGMLSDMGGIYTLGPSKGTHIHHNVIHDVESYDYGGWGIYTDEGSSDILIENNLVYRCKSGGFHQHYGKDNIIRNNIFAFSTLQQLQLTKAEPHCSFVFSNNIVLWNHGKLLHGQWAKANVKLHHNLYWNLDAEEPQGLDKDLKTWLSSREKSSIWQNPGFVDPLHGNFRFISKSPYQKIGFHPFDYTQVGVQK